MLESVDRIQVAVPRAEEAARTFQRYFDASEMGRDVPVRLGAARRTLRLGRGVVEVLEPKGPGAVQQFVESCGGGLFAAGFSCADPVGLKASLAAAGVPWLEAGDQLFIGPTPIGGLRAVISPPQRDPVSDGEGLLRFYEVTNPVGDLRRAEAFYGRAFGLETGRFQPIRSDLYGYIGTLTLFAPGRLDRIEITQPTDPARPMGRFHARRGDGLYMCFGETDDFDRLRDRLEREGARFALRPPEDGGPNVLFIHPKSLHGLFMGISLTGVAWEWSSGPRGG